MNKLCILALLIFTALSLRGQSDSTFVSIYPLDPGLNYCWALDYSEEQATNVFEAWDGSLVIQSSIRLRNDPPSGPVTITYHSPFITFSGNGEYQNTYFNNNPQFGSKQFRRVIRAEPGYYLGIGYSQNESSIEIIKLDYNFNGISSIWPHLSSGEAISPGDILAVEDGFLILGTISTNRGSLWRIDTVVAKCNFAGAVLWHNVLATNCWGNHFLQDLPDGSIIASAHNRLMRITASGDSLAYAQINGVFADQVFMVNNHIFAVQFISYPNQNQLRFFDLGENLENTSPPAHHIVYVNRMPRFDFTQGYRILHTSDGGYLLFASSSDGEVTKYDSSHHRRWSIDHEFLDSHGTGKNSIMVMQNGDYLYCTGLKSSATVNTLNAFALVRVSEGVPVNDLLEPTPSVPVITASPNPFSTIVNVNVSGRTKPNSLLNVYNLKGQLLESISITNSTVSWQPRNQASGIYLIQLKQDGKVVSTKKISYLPPK